MTAKGHNYPQRRTQDTRISPLTGSLGELGRATKTKFVFTIDYMVVGFFPTRKTEL